MDKRAYGPACGGIFYNIGPDDNCLRTELADANRRLLESERRAAAADERARTADASADDFNDIAGTFEAELKEARKQLEAEVSERKMVQVGV